MAIGPSERQNGYRLTQHETRKWLEGYRPQARKNAIRRLLAHAAVVEARMAVLRSEMTFISSRLAKLSMQARLERLAVERGPRPFREVSPVPAERDVTFEVMSPEDERQSALMARPGSVLVPLPNASNDDRLPAAGD